MEGNFAKSVVILGKMRYNITCTLRIMRGNRRLRLSKAVIPMEHVRLKVGRKQVNSFGKTSPGKGLPEADTPVVKGFGDNRYGL